MFLRFGIFQGSLGGSGCLGVGFWALRVRGRRGVPEP